MLRLRILIYVCLCACALALPALAKGALRRSQHFDRADEELNIVRYAKKFIGVRYRWGGTSPRSGFDCSGFVEYVYRHFGISLPHYTVSQYERGRRVGRRGMQPGDLVFFAGLSHVGLYIGHGKFIHAPHTGTRVSIASLRSGWYRAEFAGARRVI
jgi:cell wall-associated NlpC family hydrolase